MFCLKLQEDASYIAIMPDDSRIKLPKGVQDTPELRRELAKLGHRIAAREFIYCDKKYIKDWTINPKALSDEQVENLIEIYSDINPYNEIWKLLDEYQEESHKTISELERDVLKEHEYIHHVKKINMIKKASKMKDLPIERVGEIIKNLGK